MSAHLSREHVVRYAGIVPALVLFAVLAWHFDFIQDDAYISYRYVANFLNGDGLVFNVGERVEGFTNFGWVMYMIAWGSIGVDYILVSKVTGFAAGLGLIVLSFLLARRVLPERHASFAYIAPYLLAANLSLAYWAPAGLETATFAFMAVASLLCYLNRSWLLIAFLTAAVWLRPEGAFVTGLLIVIEAIHTRRLPRFTLMCAAGAFVASLPMVAFKLYYYGGILPNPFYAKTAWHMGQLQDGFEYAGRFLSHYAFWGGGLLLSLIAWKKLSASARVVWGFTMLYIVYVVLVGGDVLKVHRFFIPVFATLAVVHTVVIAWSAALLKGWWRGPTVVVFAIGLVGLTGWLPWDFVDRYNNLERLFIDKMEFLAKSIKQSDSSDFSVAIPTIGMFSYTLLGHDVIDMVGLTDSTIARHSEEPITGMSTTWKEQRHNSRYLLERAPEYIVFSTDIKPSAPAERALFLYKPFLDSYRSVGWYYQAQHKQRGTLVIAYRRQRPVEGALVPTYPVQWVQSYNAGLDAGVSGRYREALAHFSRALEVSPKPPYVGLVYQIGSSHMLLNQHQQAVLHLNAAIAQDSTCFEAHKDLYLYARLLGNQSLAQTHLRWVERLAPWYVSRLKEITEQEVRRQNQSRRRGAGG